MIDLIIPVYNNYDKLKRTLQSVNFNVFEVTIVDDYSNEKIHLNFPINLLRLKENSGPGQARQYGLLHTSNPYIMFIDAGDIFISKEIQEEIPEVIKTNKQMYSWLYYYKNELTTHLDNRLHGKVYSRKFLTQYKIGFSKAGSYMNEDIGFNRACRIILNNNINYIDKPIIKWIEDSDSLTQRNNNESLYKQQTRALSINSIHCINTCKNNKIDDKLIVTEINEIALALYYWFIRTAAERPEFLQEAWQGAKIFYDKYSKDIDTKELGIGSTKLVKCLKYREQIKFPINILRFIRDIKTYKNLPQWYCG